MPDYQRINETADLLMRAIEKRDGKTVRQILSKVEEVFACAELSAEDAMNLHNIIFATLENGVETVNSTEMLLEYYGDFTQLTDAILTAADLPIEVIGQQVSEQFAKLLKHIEAHFTQDLHLKQLSDDYFINFTYCSELFQKYIGMSYKEYVTKLRMDKAIALLEGSSESIQLVSEKSGYNNYYYFLKSFKDYFGISPGKYRQLIIPRIK
jgi:two-component system response regulator YesN